MTSGKEAARSEKAADREADEKKMKETTDEAGRHSKPDREVENREDGGRNRRCRKSSRCMQHAWQRWQRKKKEEKRLVAEDTF